MHAHRAVYYLFDLLLRFFILMQEIKKKNPDHLELK